MTSQPAVERAVRSGAAVRNGHGRYAVPAADVAIRTAASLGGVASHRSAATWWGWEQWRPDHEPDVTVRRRRTVRPDRRAGVALHWADLGPDDVDGLVTSRRRTVVDCLRSLPLEEALAIADSALRNGCFTKPQLVTIAAQTVGAGAGRCRRVAAAPLDCGCFVVHPDLADAERRLLLEADSFTWHGDRRALHRDCRRYNALVLAGWSVLRFSWEEVHDAAYVRACLEQARDAGRRAEGVSRRVRAG